LLSSGSGGNLTWTNYPWPVSVTSRMPNPDALTWNPDKGVFAVLSGLRSLNAHNDYPLATSSDGLAWDVPKMVIVNPGAWDSPYRGLVLAAGSLSYGNGTYVAAGSVYSMPWIGTPDGTGAAMGAFVSTSRDGVNWTRQLRRNQVMDGYAIDEGFAPNGMQFDGKQFVLAKSLNGRAGQALVSTDGATWSRRLPSPPITAGNPYPFKTDSGPEGGNDVAWTGRRHVAVGARGAYSLVSSTDSLVTWGNGSHVLGWGTGVAANTCVPPRPFVPQVAAVVPPMLPPASGWMYEVTVNGETVYRQMFQPDAGTQVTLKQNGTASGGRSAVLRAAFGRFTVPNAAADSKAGTASFISPRPLDKWRVSRQWFAADGVSATQDAPVTGTSSNKSWAGLHAPRDGFGWSRFIQRQWGHAIAEGVTSAGVRHLCLAVVTSHEHEATTAGDNGAVYGVSGEHSLATGVASDLSEGRSMRVKMPWAIPSGGPIPVSSYNATASWGSSGPTRRMADFGLEAAGIRWRQGTVVQSTPNLIFVSGDSSDQDMASSSFRPVPLAQRMVLLQDNDGVLTALPLSDSLTRSGLFTIDVRVTGGTVTAP